MAGFMERHGGKVPIIGDMFFSVLTLPFVFNYLESLGEDLAASGAWHWICMVFETMALAHMFRAYRMRPRSKLMFVAHLIYGVAFSGSAALVLIVGHTRETSAVLGLTFWGYMIAERVLSIVRKPRRWNVVFNVLAILPLLGMTFTVTDAFSTIVVMAIAWVAALVSVVSVTFSRIRLDILKDIIFRTYAAEIIACLLLLIISFSYALKYLDNAFDSYGDALWYCFAVVTTIGFGDVTPASGIGRVLSVILGLYGIVVFALITSVIVNFYGEMKNADKSAGGNGPDAGGA